MRNVFDQYSQPENRLTHALVSSLAADPVLLRRFVKWITGNHIPMAKRLEIVEQQLPGEEEPDELEAERRGLPDAWIHDGGTWALIIESKIQAPLERDQLERHRRVAERRGFTDVCLVALVAEHPKRLVCDGLRVVKWTDLYSWLRRDGASAWARSLTDYMEVLERKLVSEDYLREGTLTVFAGIPFGKDHPYSYSEAKRLLQLALAELRKRKDLRRELAMDPLGRGRPAITGREEASPWGVWNFLPLIQARNEGNFTKCPHLTLSVQYERVFACVTLPNSLKRQYRRNLLRGGKASFLHQIEDVCKDIEERLRSVEGAAPWLEIVQRRYPTQRSAPIVDARLEFDMRTARGETARRSKGRRAVKLQPEWLGTVYETFAKKRSNLQMTIGAIFPYSRCSAVHTREILAHIASVWLACKPLLRRALSSPK